MPFPLAHPAAVLPLRRWCPQYLNFAALVVGSLIPDLAACIKDLEYFSHTVAGSLVFSLPMGLITLLIVRRVRASVVSSLPEPHRKALLPLCANSAYSYPQLIVSILVGSWLHMIWDLFTHDHSWLVQSVGFLGMPIAGVPVNRLIWVVSSLAGSALVLGAYLSFVRTESSRSRHSSSTDRRPYYFWCAVLLLPFLGAIPLTLYDADGGSILKIRILAMYYLGCAYVTLVLVGLFLRRRALATSN